MAERIVVTSALPYANGSIHVGHLVEYIQTDIFVRFLKLLGKDAIYVCADDTHGTPIAISAQKKGILPEQLIEQYHKEHFEDFQKFHIHFDSYYSTNSPENKHFADYIFTQLNEKGHIYQKDVEQTYCEKCGRFLPDRYVKGNCPKCNAPDQYGDVCEKCNATYCTTDLVDPYCTICGSAPVRKVSTHYFFRLSALSGKLKKYIKGNKDFQPEIKNYLMNWIKEGLQDWCISRDGPYFGFLIPGETDKYYYVWLDAPVGYIASTAHYCKDKKRDVLKDYWQNKDAKIIHVIGKDIIYFHFLFWPAMLMESGFQLPSNILVHGFLTVNGQKMSKSRGTFFTARDFLKQYNPSYLRFYYAMHLSKKMADIDLDFADFRDVINNRLIANLGNFCFRVISFTNTKNENKITAVDDDPVIEEINAKIPLIKSHYESYNFKEAVKEIMAVSDLGNRYFQSKEPWKMTDTVARDKVLGLGLNITKILSILIAPVLPTFSEALQQQLNVKDLTWDDLTFDLENHIVNKAQPLFKKVEEVKESFFPLNLKVGQILSVADHPDADRLYILQVNLGEEDRQLVAGIRPFYAKEDLVGKHIVVVTNLKPAELKGVKSQGMLLAAGDHASLCAAPNSKPGDEITAGSLKNNTAEIDIKAFAKIKLHIQNKTLCFNDLVLKTATEDVAADAPDGAKVR